MQHKVHSTYAEHCGVGIEAVEHSCLVVFHIGLLHKFGPVVFLDIFRSLYDKACGAHCRVANLPVHLGLHQLHHHTNDVARRAELAIVAGSGHLAQDVLVDIPHCITVCHIKVLDTFHNFYEGTGILNHEDCRLHKAAVGGLFPFTESLDEDENVVTDDREHPGRLLVTEVLPAKDALRDVLVRLGIVPETFLLEDEVVGFDAQGLGVGLFLILSVVQHFHEEKIGHLLKDGH